MHAVSVYQYKFRCSSSLGATRVTIYIASWRLILKMLSKFNFKTHFMYRF